MFGYLYRLPSRSLAPWQSGLLSRTPTDVGTSSEAFKRAQRAAVLSGFYRRRQFPQPIDAMGQPIQKAK